MGFARAKKLFRFWCERTFRLAGFHRKEMNHMLQLCIEGGKKQEEKQFQSLQVFSS